MSTSGCHEGELLSTRELSLPHPRAHASLAVIPISLIQSGWLLRSPAGTLLKVPLVATKTNQTPRGDKWSCQVALLTWGEISPGEILVRLPGLGVVTPSKTHIIPLQESGPGGGGILRKPSKVCGNSPILNVC